MPAVQPPPVVFVHGLWIHATAWAPWQKLFAEHGYETHAPGWTGDADTVTQTRADPSGMDGLGVAELTAGYEEFIQALPRTPVVVGHSFGGLIAQKLLASGHAAAAVTISPAPIRGADKLPFAQIRSALPVLRWPGNKARSVALTRSQFRYAFGNALTKAEAGELYDAYAIPGPGRPVFELTAAKKHPEGPTAVDTRLSRRGPLLIVAAELDHTVPEVVSRQAHDLYSASDAVTDYHVFPGRGHALVLDHGWHDVARFALDWLASQGQREFAGQDSR